MVLECVGRCPHRCGKAGRHTTNSRVLWSKLTVPALTSIYKRGTHFGTFVTLHVCVLWLALAPSLLVTIRVSPTRGNPDLFANRDLAYPATATAYQYKSTASGALEQDAVAFVAAGGTRIHLSVYGQEYSEFSIEVNAEQFNPETLTSGQGGMYEVAFGSRKYFRVHIPAKLSELSFSFTSNTRILMNTRSTSNLVFEIPESSEQGIPVYYDSDLGALKNGSAHSRRELFFANTRGLPTMDKIYLMGPRTLHLYVSGGLEPRRADEDTVLPFSIRVDIKAANVTCIDGTQPLDSGKQTLGYGEMHFFSIHIPDSWPYLHVELLNSDKTDLLLSNTVAFPLSDNEASHVSKSCGNCRQAFSRRSIVARPKDWPERAAWGGSPSGSCSNLPSTSNTPAFIHVAVQSASSAGRTSEYQIVTFGLDDDCGWRPSCEACSSAASICSWCNTGGSHGFCGAKDVADMSGFPQSTCRNSFCPIPDPCSGHTSCGDCTHDSGCGWCANAEHGGICVSNVGATSRGPPAGTCDAWLTGPNSDCAVACKVHGIARNPCSACALDSGCGYCQSSLAGGACTTGTRAGAATGQCPRTDAKWAFGSVAACTAAGADNVNSTGAFAIPISVGAKASVGILNRANTECALGACRYVAFAFEIPVHGPHDLLATLNITETTGISNKQSSEVIRDGVRLLARSGVLPLAAEGEHDARGIETKTASGDSVLVVPLGLCDAKGSKAYFAVQLVHPPPANLGALSTINFELKVERRSSTLDVAPPDAVTALEPDWTCCGQERHVSLKLPPGTETPLAVKVKTVGEEGLRVMTRKGACPTSALADRDSGATGSVAMTVDPPPSTASTTAAAAVRWHVAIMGERGAGAGRASFSISAVSTRGNDSTANDDDDWMLTYKWYLFAMACAMVVTVIGVTAVIIYRRSRRVMPPSNALALTSDSLAHDLEIAGKRDHAHEENLLAIQPPWKRNSNENPFAIVATNEQTSEAEEQLVTLIMDLQSKIEKLETENTILKQENNFQLAATKVVKARRVSNIMTELAGGRDVSSNENSQNSVNARVKDHDLSSPHEGKDIEQEHDSPAVDLTPTMPRMAEESRRDGALVQISNHHESIKQVLPHDTTFSSAPHQDANPLFIETAEAPSANINVIEVNERVVNGVISEELHQKWNEVPTEALRPTLPADSMVSDLPANIDFNTAKATVEDINELPSSSSERTMTLPAEERTTSQKHKHTSSSTLPESSTGQKSVKDAHSSNAMFTFFVVCPDGTLLDVKNERQVLGRGIGGIRSKKVSREQAQVIVNFTTGSAELEMLGKNPGATRPQGSQDWVPLHRGVRRPLATRDEFLLLAADTNVSVGDTDEARTQVFSVVQVPPGNESKVSS